MSLTLDETRDELDDDLDRTAADGRFEDEEPETGQPEPVRATPAAEPDTAESESTGKISAKEKAKLNRAAYRKGASKAIELSGASETALTILAELTSTANDPAELAASILSAPRGLVQPLDDINELAADITDNPLAAGLTAVAWGSSRIKAVWGVLHAVGELETARVPAADVKAAMAILDPVGTLSDSLRAAIEEAIKLSARN